METSYSSTLNIAAWRLEHSRIREKHSTTSRVSPYTSFVLYRLLGTLQQNMRSTIEAYHEKTHTACTVSIPESSIQFLILLVQEIVEHYLRALQVSSPYDTSEVL